MNEDKYPIKFVSVEEIKMQCRNQNHITLFQGEKMNKVVDIYIGLTSQHSDLMSIWYQVLRLCRKINSPIRPQLIRIARRTLQTTEFQSDLRTRSEETAKAETLMNPHYAIHRYLKTIIAKLVLNLTQQTT